TVLQRHAGDFKDAKGIDDMKKMIDDPKTPPDLKQALQTVVNDPGLMSKLDSAANGQHDGLFNTGDIAKLAEDPQIKQANEAKASEYAQNYIPSDDQGKSPQGRPITETDAQTELYKYADVLPRDMSLDELKKIADGSTTL